jgi:hypothetical protein
MTTITSVTFLAQEILNEDLPDYQAASRTLSTETSIKRSPHIRIREEPRRAGIEELKLVKLVCQLVSKIRW